jgi:hypothetical protein
MTNVFGQLTTTLTGAQRFNAMMRSWQEAPRDVEAEVRGGEVDGATYGALLISFNNTDHMLTVPEAKAAIEILRKAIAEFPDAANWEELDSLASGIEAAVAAFAESRRP